MRLSIILALTFIFFVPIAIATPHQESMLGSENRDGSSIAKAIIIKTKDERAGVASEYQWILARYPGFKRSSQELWRGGGHSYDEINIFTANGEHRKFYFDITSCYGKS